ncbi:TSUP family transporter [Aquipuribacter sp. SD81]|uniref:TSUP family transporter n=1 Tax=Aquipuribacter sp. SD81 TaxID=3127703 RepID=UPI003015BC3E
MPSDAVVLDPLTLSACLVVVALGALVQGVLGFGLALLAVPVLVFLVPGLVPVGVLVAVLPLVVLQALRERAHVDARGFGWALVGRVPGGLAGAAAVALLPVRGLQLLVAATVLAAVGAAVHADSPRRVRRDGLAGPDPELAVLPPAGGATARQPRRATLALAGALSGLGGTTSGIGGPPMAIAYRNAGGQVLRATLATFFLVGALLSLGSLLAVGEVSTASLAQGAVLVPAVVVGYLAAAPLRRRVDPVRVRQAVLVVSAAAGAGLLVQALLP